MRNADKEHTVYAFYSDTATTQLYTAIRQACEVRGHALNVSTLTSDHLLLIEQFLYTFDARVVRLSNSLSILLAILLKSINNN